LRPIVSNVVLRSGTLAERRVKRACSRNRWPGEAYRLLEKESA
jgi:hypothetical protein